MKKVRDQLAETDASQWRDMTFKKFSTKNSQCSYAIDGDVRARENSIYETRMLTMSGSDLLRVSLVTDGGEPVWIYFKLNDYSKEGLEIAYDSAPIRGWLALDQDRGGTPRCKVGYASEVVAK